MTPSDPSADGGGIRGLSELIILKEIMQRIEFQEERENILPCEYFDLICGTSTGG
jgi:patatin-like phospholipase/acyl hydrolase